MPRTIRTSSFWKAVKRLRVVLAPKDGLPVRVRTTDRLPEDTLGDTSKHEEYYLIRMSKEAVKQMPDMACLLLAHEWAHVLNWGCSEDHGDAWGVKQAHCWRLICGEYAQGGANE